MRSLDSRGRSLQDTLADASAMLSGLSAAAGLVLAPKSDGLIKHIEFVALGHDRALVVLVGADGQVREPGHRDASGPCRPRRWSKPATTSTRG